MHVNRSWTLDCRSKGLEASHPAFRTKSINIETEPMFMLFDSIKIGRLDEEAQPSAYPRRGVLKAGLLIGAVARVAMKAGAAGSPPPRGGRQPPTFCYWKGGLTNPLAGNRFR